MKQLITKISKFACHPKTRRAVYLITIACFVACLIIILTKRKDDSSYLKQRLDSLEVRSKLLEDAQVTYDSLISEQKRLSTELDIRISGIKEKTIIIREHYIKEQAKVDSFNNSQLDSFFRTKYQY